MLPVIRRAETQKFEAKLSDQLKILFPPVIVTAFGHLIHPHVTAIPARDKGIAVLDPCGEEKTVRLAARAGQTVAAEGTLHGCRQR